MILSPLFHASVGLLLLSNKSNGFIPSIALGNTRSFLWSIQKTPYPTKSFSTTLHSSATNTYINSLESTSPSNEDDPTSTRPYSRAFRSMVGGDTESMDHFLRHTWQKKPQVYRKSCESTGHTTERDNPLYNQVNMGLNGLTNVLEQACEKFLEPPHPNWQVTLPMVFDRHKQAIPLPELAGTYGNDLFGAYLEGCSIVLNHCDELCPFTAELCEDLQLSFPYAYANGYLTPPASQAVAAHADDRDVFVIQVYGEKAWNVYENVPVPYPYSHEQVGKNGFTVPANVLEGPRSIETTLLPGDVLYIPRGHVHEACTYTNIDDPSNTKEKYEKPSFHITIALATFDWSLTNVINTAVQKALDSQPQFRMAVPLDFGKQHDINNVSQDALESFDKQLDQAFSQIRQAITSETINSFLGKKYYWHRRQSRPIRMKRIMDWKNKNVSGNTNNEIQEKKNVSKVMGTVLLGSDAARQLTMSSKIRYSTEEERLTVLSANKSLRVNNFRQETQDTFQTLRKFIMENPAKDWAISELKSLIISLSEELNYESGKILICDLTLLCFIRYLLESGEIALVR